MLHRPPWVEQSARANIAQACGDLWIEPRCRRPPQIAGFTAVYITLAHPQVFGKAGVYSVHLGAGSIDPLMELVKGPRKDGVEVFVARNRWDVRQHAGGFDLKGDSQRLAKALEGRGYPVSGGEQVDSFGWGAARAMGDDLLEALFPLEEGGEVGAGE
jgi:hypothetical protein